MFGNIYYKQARTSCRGNASKVERGTPRNDGTKEFGKFLTNAKATKTLVPTDHVI
jgi:hypothetical protein